MNMPATEIQEYTVSLTREFNASPEKVFQAWTDPEMLRKWFGPKGVRTEPAEVDVRIGGAYQFIMTLPDGNVVNHYGKYKEIDPPRRLVFTWVLEGQACEGSADSFAETLVSIEFEDMGGATRLTLTHDLLPTEESRAGHEFGWTDSFERLVDNLQG
jgi:uncharacterized protein YndB with AHSA1/START domain